MRGDMEKERCESQDTLCVKVIYLQDTFPFLCSGLSTHHCLCVTIFLGEELTHKKLIQRGRGVTLCFKKPGDRPGVRGQSGSRNMTPSPPPSIMS